MEDSIVSKADRKKPLNPRQERFILEVVKTGSPRLSAINAGYKESNASSTAVCLMKDPRIAQAIQVKRNAIHKELLKDRSTFLSEVGGLKALCLEQKRISDLVKLLNLEAEVLNLKKPDNQTQVNVFGTLQEAQRMFDTPTTGSVVDA